MLSINHFGSGKAAKDYYSEHLSKGDYYAKDAEVLQPRFEGLTAKMLGIEGKAVDQQSFFALVDNKHPVTGEQLTSRMKAERRSMTDLTFDVPKSVTLVSLIDPRVKAAVESSIDDTMREIERAMCVRVRKGGNDHDRQTGNMIYVKWPHETTRPLSDGTVDPHLHRHVTAINVSYDPIEKVYKATQFGNIVRDKGYYQAAYHARLAEKLSGLGYGIQREQKSFRLMGIEKATLEKFSRRTSVIEEKAKALGIVDPEAKADLGRKTRNRKGNELGSDELTRQWIGRLTPKELTSLERAGSGIYRGKNITAKDAMDYAVEHSFTKKSVVTERKLLQEALVQGVGSVTVAGAHGQLEDAEIIRKEKDGVKYVTTRKVYQEELEIVAFARDGKGKCAKLGDTEKLGDGLSAEQRKAAVQILKSRDRVIGLSGRAGTGKTTMMRATVAAIESSGLKVFTYAPSADASRGVLKESGFANANTLATLLTNKELQQKTAGHVIWVDEAGLMPAEDTKKLFAIAKANKSRVILSGDTKQHSSVARGDALRIIETEAGLKFAELRENRRQLNEAYKSAVDDISRGDVTTDGGRKLLDRGLKKLDDMGSIVVADDVDRYQKAADDYLAAGQKNGLVVTFTHAEASKVTERIRSGLAARNQLRGKEHNLDTLYAIDWSTPERRDALNYEPGMVVQFSQRLKGFERGSRAEVVTATVDGVAVKSGNKVLRLPLQDAEQFQVFRKSVTPVAEGELIRITKNWRGKDKGKEKRLDNGMICQVAGFTEKGEARLTDGFVLPKDFSHFSYAYTATSFASQGKSKLDVILSASKDSLTAANFERFYVASSRGINSLKIYTDDKQAVFEAVQKSGARMSATELLGKPPKAATDMNRVRRVYNAIKERAQQAITNVKEKTYDRRRA